MNGQLTVRNRQRVCPLNLRLLRRITRHLLAEHFRPQHFELCIHLVSPSEMVHLNETFLNHSGSTDVITFDHSEPPRPAPRVRHQASCLSGEIFISLHDAITQARQFRTTWQSELTRYVIHGLLHLQGYDDLAAAKRKIMKREENRLLRSVARSFPLAELARRPGSQKS